MIFPKPFSRSSRNPISGKNTKNATISFSRNPPLSIEREVTGNMGKGKIGKRDFGGNCWCWWKSAKNQRTAVF
jgi:hypothetical protein